MNPGDGTPPTCFAVPDTLAATHDLARALVALLPTQITIRDPRRPDRGTVHLTLAYDPETLDARWFGAPDLGPAAGRQLLGDTDGLSHHQRLRRTDLPGPDRAAQLSAELAQVKGLSRIWAAYWNPWTEQAAEATDAGNPWAAETDKAAAEVADAPARWALEALHWLRKTGVLRDPPTLATVRAATVLASALCHLAAVGMPTADQRAAALTLAADWDATPADLVAAVTAALSPA